MPFLIIHGHSKTIEAGLRGSLGLRPFLQKKVYLYTSWVWWRAPVIPAHSALWEAEAGESQIQTQFDQFSDLGLISVSKDQDTA